MRIKYQRCSTGLPRCPGDGVHRLPRAQARLPRPGNQPGHPGHHGLAERLPDGLLRSHLRHPVVAVLAQELQRRLHRHGPSQGRLARQDRKSGRRGSRHRGGRRRRLVGAEEHHQAAVEEQEPGPEGHQGVGGGLHHRRSGHHRKLDHLHGGPHREVPERSTEASG